MNNIMTRPSINYKVIRFNGEEKDHYHDLACHIWQVESLWFWQGWFTTDYWQICLEGLDGAIQRANKFVQETDQKTLTHALLQLIGYAEYLFKKKVG